MVPMIIPFVQMVMPMVPLALPMVQLVPMVSQWYHMPTNGTIGKIANGTIGRTPNVTICNVEACTPLVYSKIGFTEIYIIFLILL